MKNGGIFLAIKLTFKGICLCIELWITYFYLKVPKTLCIFNQTDIQVTEIIT